MGSLGVGKRSTGVPPVVNKMTHGRDARAPLLFFEGHETKTGRGIFTAGGSVRGFELGDAFEEGGTVGVEAGEVGVVLLLEGGELLFELGDGVVELAVGLVAVVHVCELGTEAFKGGFGCAKFAKNGMFAFFGFAHFGGVGFAQEFEVGLKAGVGAGFEVSVGVGDSRGGVEFLKKLVTAVLEGGLALRGEGFEGVEFGVKGVEFFDEEGAEFVEGGGGTGAGLVEFALEGGDGLGVLVVAGVGKVGEFGEVGEELFAAGLGVGELVAGGGEVGKRGGELGLGVAELVGEMGVAGLVLAEGGVFFDEGCVFFGEFGVEGFDGVAEFAVGGGEGGVLVNGALGGVGEGGVFFGEELGEFGVVVFEFVELGGEEGVFLDGVLGGLRGLAKGGVFCGELFGEVGVGVLEFEKFRGLFGGTGGVGGTGVFLRRGFVGFGEVEAVEEGGVGFFRADFARGDEAEFGGVWRGVDEGLRGAFVEGTAEMAGGVVDVPAQIKGGDAFDFFRSAYTACYCDIVWDSLPEFFNLFCINTGHGSFTFNTGK